MYIYTKIVNYLDYLIRKNSDNEEFLLPSESQLCAKFNASRVSVRRAFEELKKNDLIYSEKGKGYYINTKNSSLKNNIHRKKLSFTFISTTLNRHHRINILNGINQFCNQNDISCTAMLSYNDPLLEQNKLHEAIDMQTDGIILFPSDCNIYSMELFKLLKYKTPIVLVDRNLHGLNLPYISSNHFEMAYKAIEWFYKRNIKEIVYISHQDDISSAVRDRQNGIQKGLLDFMGRINKHNLIYDSLPKSELYNFYYEYFSNHPEINGIIYTTSENLQYLFKALQDLNRKVNEDVFLIFIDDEHLVYSEYGATSHPTILQDGFSIGYTAASSLLKLIHNPNDSFEEIYIPVKYINWD